VSAVSYQVGIVEHLFNQPEIGHEVQTVDLVVDHADGGGRAVYGREREFGQGSAVRTHAHVGAHAFSHVTAGHDDQIGAKVVDEFLTFRALQGPRLFELGGVAEHAARVEHRVAQRILLCPGAVAFRPDTADAAQQPLVADRHEPRAQKRAGPHRLQRRLPHVRAHAVRQTIDKANSGQRLVVTALDLEDTLNDIVPTAQHRALRLRQFRMRGHVALQQRLAVAQVVLQDEVVHKVAERRRVTDEHFSIPVRVGGLELARIAALLCELHQLAFDVAAALNELLMDRIICCLRHFSVLSARRTTTSLPRAV
jgi:hypothetical protein